MADRRLQVFHAVAKHQSFTKAAEALFMTQPAVTFQIKQLEQHFLGFAILSKSTIAKEVRIGTLVGVPLSPRLILNFSLVYPKERFRSRLVNTFVQFARERLAAMQAS